MSGFDFHQILNEHYAMFIKINSIYSAFAKEKGLSYHALFILYAIYHSKDGCTPKEICDKWLIPKQTINSVLRIFDKRGFVCYETCSHDRRNKKVFLSVEGRGYAEPILNALYSAETAAFEKMGKETVQQLIYCNQLFYQGMAEEIERNENEKSILE